jgi:hypothetical protein
MIEHELGFCMPQWHNIERVATRIERPFRYEGGSTMAEFCVYDRTLDVRFDKSIHTTTVGMDVFRGVSNLLSVLKVTDGEMVRPAMIMVDSLH